MSNLASSSSRQAGKPARKHSSKRSEKPKHRHSWHLNMRQDPSGTWSFGCNLLKCRVCGTFGNNSKVAQRLMGISASAAERLSSDSIGSVKAKPSTSRSAQSATPDTEEARIYLVAGRFEEVASFIREYEVAPWRVRFVSNAERLRGMTGMVIYHGTFRDRPDLQKIREQVWIMMHAGKRIPTELKKR